MEQFTPVASREPRRPGPPRVLVVDDDSTLRRLCARILHRDGYHVFEAADGQEGLELALARALDLVVLDISMPVLDGFALATALRNHERTRDIPLVFLTAEKDPLVKGKGLRDRSGRLRREALRPRCAQQVGGANAGAPRSASKAFGRRGLVEQKQQGVSRRIVVSQHRHVLGRDGYVHAAVDRRLEIGRAR
jgi:CheY-like chemotaxis protein